MSASELRLPVLATKLYWAGDGANVLRRARLIETLQRALGFPITLVIAPAGYGKSTLLHSWLSELDIPAGMVRLDATDNTPNAFLTCLVSAVHSALPDALPTTTDLLLAPSAPPVNIVWQTLIQELHQVERDFVIVLDDFDQIAHHDNLNQMRDLLRNMPPALHLLIAGRSEPDLQLARLRAQGAVLDLNVADLRFSAEETEKLLPRVTRRNLEPETVEWLMKYTDGWVTGIRLVLSSLERIPHAAVSLPSSQLRDERMLDYLSQEVFSTFTPAEQDFLIRTSILTDVSVTLAQAVLELPDPAFGHHLLQRMWRESSFVTSLDHEATWFSYHPLLREFLVTQLQNRHSATAIAGLHARASQWLAEHGRLDEGYAHAQASSSEAAASFIIAHRHHLYDEDDWERLGRWLLTLPEPLINHSPELMMAQAFVAYRYGRMREFRSCIERAETLLAKPAMILQARALDGELLVLRGMLAGWNATEGELMTLGSRAVEALADSPFSFLRITAGLIQAAGYQTIGQHRQAFDLMLGMLHDTHPRRAPQTHHILHVLCLSYWQYGYATEVQAIAQRLLELGVQTHRSDWEALAHYFLACASYDVNDLPEASQHFQTVLDHPFRVETIYLLQSSCGLAHSLTATGQHAEADAVIRRAWSILLDAGNTEFIPTLQNLRLELALHQGVIPAEGWAGAPPPARTLGLSRGVYEPALTRVRLLLAKGDENSLAQAATMLDEMLQTMEQMRRRRAIIHTLILQALVFEARGARHTALKRLTRALQMVEQGGEIRIVLDYTPAITPLVLRVPAQSLAPDFRARLVQAMIPAPNRDESATLSDRELEVLRLLDSGLTNQEIAGQLVLTTGTVKQHLNHIYRKLGVSRRTEALREGRKRGLLIENTSHRR